MHYNESSSISEHIASASRIVIIQADNPDADSLGSALALEAMLGELGKDTLLYCAVDIPSYLHYLPGWSRVTNDLPSSFDLSIIVDASTETLLDALKDTVFRAAISRRPSLVIDHHAVVLNPISFATVSLIDAESSSTGEVLFTLARDCNWDITVASGEPMLAAILGDTQGLTNDLTKASTYRAVADIVELGVDRQLLEEARKSYSKMPESIFRYKADLIDRTEILSDGAVAFVHVPQDEINQYSALYNPAPLIQADHLQTQGVRVSIVMKHYTSGRVTAALRAAYNSPVANKIAEAMGGGGHAYAAGFKIEDGRSYDDIKTECLKVADEQLQKLEA